MPDGSQTSPYQRINDALQNSYFDTNHNIILSTSGIHLVNNPLALSKAGVTIKSGGSRRAKLQLDYPQLTGLAGLTLLNLEIYSSSTQRETAYEDFHDIPFNDLTLSGGGGVTLQGCYLHDLGQLFIGGGSGGNILLVDCVLANFGVKAPLRWHGHLFYSQNGTIYTITMRNCILLPTGAYGWHGYSAASADVLNYVMEDNTVLAALNTFSLDSASQHIDNITIRDNIIGTNGASVRLGQGSATLGALTLEDNRLVLNAAFDIAPGWASLTNTGTVTNGNVVKIVDCQAGTLALKHVTIVNYDQLDTVPVTFDGLDIGQDYELVSAYDPTDVQNFAYDGDPVDVNMTGTSVALPIGYAEPLGVRGKRVQVFELWEAA